MSCTPLGPPSVHRALLGDEAASVLSPAPHGKENVLVVEDDKGVRTVVRRILQSRGYTVLEGASAAEGLAAAASFAAPIHLLLADVVLPDMGAGRLVSLLTAFRPETKVLYFSGYGPDMVARYGGPSDEDRLLRKPFTAGGLLDKVREVLDSPPAA